MKLEPCYRYKRLLNSVSGAITKDGHTMFLEDVLYDIKTLQRKS